MEDHLLYALIAVAGVGIAAQWLSWRFQIPAIIFLMAGGLAAGPIFGWIQPARDFGPLLHPLISLSVAVILFEGGLNLRLYEYREAGVDVNRLVGVTTVLTWIFGSAAAYSIGGLSLPIAVVFGAIIVVTGPTVILPMLRHSRLKRRTASLLKWEGIINDPLGAMLAVLVFEYFIALEQGATVPQMAGRFVFAAVVAVGSGAATGWLLGRSFFRGYVPEYLQSQVMIAAIFGLYGAADRVLEGGGLLAVTVCGVVLGNQRLRSIQELRRFKEYITILLVSVVFILVTADIDLKILERLGWRSAVLLGTIIFLIRPLAVYLSTIGTGILWRERLLVGWIAPRGIVAAAVSALFGHRLTEHGYPDGEQLPALVFSLIFLTVSLHGVTIRWLAKRLRLSSENAHGLLIVGASPWAIQLGVILRRLKVPVILTDVNWTKLRAARMAGLTTHPGEILSERSEEKLDLNEVSHLLAATENDSYNALVCNRFSHDLGRNQVFQLPSHYEEEDGKGPSRTVRGRIAFEGRSKFEDFMRYHYLGWQFHQTQLSEDYSFEDYAEGTPDGTVSLLAVSKLGEIQFFPLENVKKLRPGDVIVNYQPPNSNRKKGPDSGGDTSPGL